MLQELHQVLGNMAKVSLHKRGGSQAFMSRRCSALHRHRAGHAL
jgi:hypothetical protein